MYHVVGSGIQEMRKSMEDPRPSRRIAMTAQVFLSSLVCVSGDVWGGRKFNFGHGNPTAGASCGEFCVDVGGPDPRFTLNRANLNIGVLAGVHIEPALAGPGSYICPWADRFRKATGIPISVHIFYGWLDDTYPGVEEERRICSQYPLIEGYYLFGTGGNMGPGSKDWGAPIKTAIVQGLLGPIDVWLSLAAQEVPNLLWDKLSRGDLFEDLSSRLAQDSYDFTSVPGSVRDYFLTDGSVRTSLPTKANVFHLVHNDDYVNLPPGAATWDELLVEVRRLSAEDRDGDGEPDKPVCLPGSDPWSTIFFCWLPTLDPQTSPSPDLSAPRPQLPALDPQASAAGSLPERNGHTPPCSRPHAQPGVESSRRSLHHPLLLHAMGRTPGCLAARAAADGRAHQHERVHGGNQALHRDSQLHHL